MEAYKAVVGQQQFARGAVIGLLLLLPAVLAFGLERLVQRRQHAQMASRAQPYAPRANRLRDAAFLLLALLVAGWILLIHGHRRGASLVKLWPYNLELTLRNYDFDNMDGGGWLAYRNSLKLATLTAVFGTALIFTGAWLLERPAPAARRPGRTPDPPVHPAANGGAGLVLGLGYVFFFNHPANPLHGLYGGMALLVLCTIMHCATTAHLTSVSALGQLDPVFEAVSASLKVGALRTFWRVTLPICLPTVLANARYLFVSAMTTVSAVIFLYSPDTVLASVAVLNMDDAGDIGPAAAMSTLILLTSIAATLLLSLLTHRTVRRTQAGAARRATEAVNPPRAAGAPPCPCGGRRARQSAPQPGLRHKTIATPPRLTVRRTLPEQRTDHGTSKHPDRAPRSAPATALRTEAAILDWAGTVIDFGSFAPTQIFVEAFAEFGVAITLEEARGPMGMGKWDHIRALCNDAAIAARFARHRGMPRPMTTSPPSTNASCRCRSRRSARIRH